jgi:Fe2+ or Zn2+ uptake regulation protein
MSPSRPSPAAGPVPTAEVDAGHRYAEMALSALRTEGLRITRPRRSVVELLEKSSQPLTPAAVHDALKRRRIDIDLASVYRTLAVLEGRGLTHRLSAVEGVVRCEDPRLFSACHHHRICVLCGEVREFRCSPEQLRQFDAPVQAGFRVEGHRLELTGCCEACSTRKG